MVNTLFGQNPKVSLKNSASSATSVLESAGSGVTSGMIFGSKNYVSHYKKNYVNVTVFIY
ncbi:MAG: Uncharacterised protein [Porticoccaceae bacterium UBA1117]|nr:MAG: Uncharacterised protein [Porticoccaceae bacterium UBA1117]